MTMGYELTTLLVIGTDCTPRHDIVQVVVNIVVIMILLNIELFYCKSLQKKHHLSFQAFFSTEAVYELL
jgi:hypothetical protein